MTHHRGRGGGWVGGGGWRWEVAHILICIDLWGRGEGVLEFGAAREGEKVGEYLTVSEDRVRAGSSQIFTGQLDLLMIYSYYL